MVKTASAPNGLVATMPARFPVALNSWRSCVKIADRKDARRPELVDPSTEEPRLLCNTCFNRAAGKLLRRHQWTPNRRVHADDPAFALLAEAGYLVRQSS